MATIKQTAQLIAEVGAHGDPKLSNRAFVHDDRRERLHKAAAGLADWVGMRFEDDELDQGLRARIAEAIALGMMLQFEHDQKCGGEMLTALTKGVVGLSSV
jgi:hypothetical protein